MLADLLVVDGDPSQDIAVLQDRTKIEQIILDGAVVEIDRDIESWPHQPSYVYANTYLTQETAKGGGRPPRAAIPAPPGPDSATRVPGHPIAE